MKPVIIIAIAICGGLAVFGVLASMDVNSAQELQFMTLGGTDMDFMTLTFDTDLAVCNPTNSVTSFDRIDSVIYYKGKEVGTYTISGNTFQPNIAKDVDSRFTLNGQNTLQMILGGLFAGFTGQNIDFDENELKIVSTVEKSILGIIPTTTTLTMTPSQSQSNFISGDRMNEWKCGWTPKLKQVAESYGADTSIPLETYIERANQGDTSLIDSSSTDITEEFVDRLTNLEEDEFHVYYGQCKVPSGTIFCAQSDGFDLTVDIDKLIIIDEPVVLIGYLKNQLGNSITNYAIYLLDSSEKQIEMIKTSNDGKFRFSLDSRELYEKNGSNQVLFVKTHQGNNEIKLPIRFIIQDNS